MKTPTRWLTNSRCITQLLSTPSHSLSLYQIIMKAVFQQLQSDLCVAVATEQSPHRPSLPKLDILSVDADEETQVEWEQEDDVKGGHLNPVEVKIARQKEIQYLWDREVYEYATEAEARARLGRNLIPTKVAPKNRVTARVWCLWKCAQGGRADLLSNTPFGSSASPALCRVSRRHLSCGRSLHDLNCRGEPSPLLRGRSTRCVCPIAGRGPEGKGARRMWKTTTNDVRILGRCSTVERTLYSALGGEDFLEAGQLRATSSTKACKSTSWCTVTTFFYRAPA